MVCPVVMYEMWELDCKKAERQRIDAFELWCWRRLLRVRWTARRSNQSILKEISPEYSLDGLMLKLKLQYFGHLMWRNDSVEKTLMLGKIEVRGKGDDRGWDSWMASPTRWTWVWVSPGSWWWTGNPGCSPWGCKESDTTERLNWTLWPNYWYSPKIQAFVAGFTCMIINKHHSSSAEGSALRDAHW